MILRIGLLLTLFVLHIPVAHARPHQAIDSIDVLDEQIKVCLNYLANGKIDEAGLLARQIAWRFPDFALGHLIAAEMESVRALQDIIIADGLPMPRNVSELLLEARQRLAAQRFDTPFSTSDSVTLGHEQTLPGDLIQIGNHLAHVLVVDLQSSLLSQFDVSKQRIALVREHYIGSGEGGFGKRLEGDLKTPLGVYDITEFRPDESLPDLYGSGALTLNYPNALDTHLGRTGYGIWLHGVPSRQSSRTPYSSEGCVTMSNQHLTRLSREVDVLRTKVIMTDDATPLDRSTHKKLQLTFRDLFKIYQRAQQTGNQEQLDLLRNDQATLPSSLISDNRRLTPVSDRELATIELHEQLLYNVAFANIRPEDISIFRHPDISDRTAPFQEFMVTEALFGTNNEYHISVYWAQNLTGKWQVLTDVILGPGM